MNATKTDKFLTFKLGEESYGLEILKVREIIGIMNVTRVPKTPDYVRGVINLRGKVIPVIELRKKFEMDTVEDTEETCIIVVDLDTVELGMVVDKVNEVLNIKESEIEETPQFDSSVNTDFILGIGKVNNRVTILLDIDKVLTNGALEQVTDVSGTSHEQEMEA